ncbi:MAG: hypothetical protein ACJ8FY_17195 [Gemmataceae bacterium]
MNYSLRTLVLIGGALLLPALLLQAADDKKKDGTAVELDGLKSKAPADWKTEPTTNQMRAYQFKLPNAKDEKANAELIIFYFGPGGGGSAEENVKRWKGMMAPPQGKKIDDVAKVDKFKVGDVAVTYLDVEGTYLAKERPFDPNSKVEKKPDYRMLGVVFESPKGPYFMRVTGPAKTVAEQKKAFDGWLKNFK